MCSCARPIGVKGKDETPLHNKHGERSYSSRNQSFWVPWITDLVHLGATTSHSRYHDIMSGVPQYYARGTKWRNSFKCSHNKRWVLNLLFQSPSHCEYYEWLFYLFRKSKGSFYDTKTLIMVFYCLGGNAFLPWGALCDLHTNRFI